MERQDVIATIARVARKNVKDVGEHVSLQSLGLNASFGLNAVRSLIEAATKTKLPVITLQTRVGELVEMSTSQRHDTVESLVVGGVNAGKSGALVVAEQQHYRAIGDPSIGGVVPPVATAFGLGLDIQEVDDFPSCDDYRSSDFYKGLFSPREIATAMLRHDPRVHLSGIFCAKEAVKKSHPKLIHLRMDEITIEHDASGKPLVLISKLESCPTSPVFTLSISHTSRMAAATCLTIWPTD